MLIISFRSPFRIKSLLPQLMGMLPAGIHHLSLLFWDCSSQRVLHHPRPFFLFKENIPKQHGIKAWPSWLNLRQSPKVYPILKFQVKSDNTFFRMTSLCIENVKYVLSIYLSILKRLHLPLPNLFPFLTFHRCFTQKNSIKNLLAKKQTNKQKINYRK